MDDFKKKIGKILIFVIILCCICLIGLYLLNRENLDGYLEDNSVEVEEEKEYSVKKIKDPAKFFSIQTCIQDNLNKDFIAIDMNIFEGNRMESYSVYGTDKNNTPIYCIVKVDIENNTFLIEELNNQYDNIDEINLESNLKEIKHNGKNVFKQLNLSDEDICRIYFEQILKLELEEPKKAYSLLNEDYRKKRFPTFQEYQEYLEEYQEIIKEAVLSKYLVQPYEDYTEYTLIDVYNNSYILQATSVMNYTIKLDDYTIKVNNFMDNYKKLSYEDKVQSNVYIFMKMINTKDYKHAYELLDDTFRNNNFDTLEKFKMYVQDNFFPYNLCSSHATIKKEGNYYIYESTLKENSSSAAETKKLAVIMKLKEGTDFVMSFNIE